MVFHKDYKHAMDNDYNFHSIVKLSSPTSPFTAKQLAEFGARLNEGVNNVEVGTLKEDLFDTIPKEHFDEIRRLAKLTNSSPSVHAPLIEPSGFGERNWSEQQRVANQEQLKSVLDRAHMLDPKGNIPVDFHGANIQSVEWDKSLGKKNMKVWDAVEQKKVVKEVEIPRTMVAVNQLSGEMTPLQYEEKAGFGGEVDIWDPYRRLENLNETTWDKDKLDILSQEKIRRELEFEGQKLLKQMEPYKRAVESGVPLTSEQKENINNITRNLSSIQGHMEQIDIHTRSGFKELFNKFKKFVDKDGEGYKEFVKKGYGDKLKQAEDDLVKFPEYLKKLDLKKLSEKEIINIQMKQKQLYDNLVSLTGHLPTPDVFKPVNEFAKEKASETIAEVAFHGFQKYGEDAPVLAIENSYPSMPLSRADELKDALEIARKKFVQKAVKEGVNSDKARDLANKLIGATWDIGHINMMRRAGYTEEEVKKFGIEEAKRIAPLIKHLHITDNFGFSDTHLPPGMGKVPFKEILEAVEKKIGKAEMMKLKGVVEAGAFAKEFEQSPFPYVLESFGYPVYTGGAAGRQFYGTSTGTYIEFPREHFNLYGSGFSTLPKELGGQVENEKGRFMQGQ